MNEKRFMDVSELSDYLGISKWLIYKYIKLREVPFIPFGRLVRFDRLAIDKWAEKRMVRGFRKAAVDAQAAPQEKPSPKTEGFSLGFLSPEILPEGLPG